jgi:uncharacterized caspase-like protein/TPR repeat protein
MGERGGRQLRILVFALSAVVLAATAIVAETRVALVVGNAAYANLEPLKNPTADAADIAEALRRLGFAVTLGTDLDREGMLAAISGFERAAAKADVSLFYYAGHGFQIDALNYLLPVDAELDDPEDVPRWAVPLDEVTSGLTSADAIRLIFLDACRNNPLRGHGDRPSTAPQDGLARVGDAAGFLYVFATQPDNVAYDGIGRNSYFASALLGHIETPGQDVASTLIGVRRDVLAATGGKQIPWENSSLTREFAFAPGDEGAPVETLLWQVAATAQDTSLMRIYRDRFPEGAHAADVSAFLDGAEGGNAARDLAEPTAPGLADTLWEVARRLRLRPLVEAYLARDPAGRHAGDARRMLVELPAAEDPAVAPELACERLATHPRDATANVAGVPFSNLQRNPAAAVEACSRAAAAHPDMPHYTALLARATAAAGDRGGAARLYRDAADRGDLRAMVSLGLSLEAGDGVARDPAGALDWYERAADGGSPDGAINLAVALMEGKTVPRDAGRGLALLDQAAAAGSAIATYNLGVLALRGVAPGGEPEALARFRRAIQLGEPQGNIAAAILVDQGRNVPRDPATAAGLLLAGVASDSGEARAKLLGRPLAWSPDTIRAMQVRLAKDGLYDGALDGRIGPRFHAALRAWRTGGFLAGANG